MRHKENNVNIIKKIISRIRSVLHPKETTLEVNEIISGVAAHQKQRGMKKLMQNLVLKSPYTGSRK